MRYHDYHIMTFYDYPLMTSHEYWLMNYHDYQLMIFPDYQLMTYLVCIIIVNVPSNEILVLIMFLSSAVLGEGRFTFERIHSTKEQLFLQKRGEI